MPLVTILSISALIALIPAALLPYRRDQARDPTFWVLLAVAVAGPLVVVYVLFLPGWRTGLSPALWLTVAVTLAVYAAVAAWMREAWRLTPLLLPYLILFGVVATIWQNQPGRPLSEAAPAAWTGVHILLAVIAYALLTLGAVAGFAVFLQERALKAKRPTKLTRRLPPVADAEVLQVRLLTASAVVLACGLLSGMGLQFIETGTIVEFAHKTLLSLLTFAVIVGLLIAHYRTGVRGRRAARIVLLAYLLLTLAYPGVKFVTDVMLA